MNMQPILNYGTAVFGENFSALPQQQPRHQFAGLTAFLSKERIRENLTHSDHPLPNQQPKPDYDSMYTNLRKQFELRDESVVRAYLRKYPFLFAILFEAKAQVARIFGQETRNLLQVSVDPNDMSSQLFIVIPTHLNAKQALELFDKLDQEWWMDAAKRADFRLNFIPEFI